MAFLQLWLGEMLSIFLQPLMQALCCPFYCCWCRLLHYGEGKCCPFFSRWYRRYGTHFTAVGAAFYTTARVNAARFSAVRVGVTLPKIFCWYLTRTFTQLNDGDLALLRSFCGTNTLLLLVVGAPQQYFCLPRPLTQRLSLIHI